MIQLPIRTFILILTVFALYSTASATSGWDNYGHQVSGGYQLDGNQNGFVIGRSDGRPFATDANFGDVFVAFFDDPEHLFLCSGPNEGGMLGLQGSEWSKLVPFEGARFWVLQKKTGKIVGPYKEAALDNYLTNLGITFSTWTSAAELGFRAGDDKWAFKLILIFAYYPWLFLVLLAFLVVLLFLLRRLVRICRIRSKGIGNVESVRKDVSG